MPRYLMRRVAQILPVILALVIFNFVLVHIAPGDPATALAGDNAPLEYIEELRASYGLNEPLHVQLGIYLQKLVQGDLGYSFAYRKPVLEVLLSRLAPTLLLVGISQLIAIPLGILLGALAARHRNSWLDTFISTSMLALYSIPVFWLGLVFILYFAVHLQWLPSSGMMGFTYGRSPDPFDIARHLVLPLSVLVLHSLPTYGRITRESVIEAAQDDSIVTARAIGYSESVVFRRFALRNALLPVVTLAGLSLSSLFAGALLVETVFAWPGMGRLMYDAVSQRDFPVLMGGFLFTSIMVVIGSLITDIVYVYLDPRVVYK
jgi:peptide/nickel transport system permease protein